MGSGPDWRSTTATKPTSNPQECRTFAIKEVAHLAKPAISPFPVRQGDGINRVVQPDKVLCTLSSLKKKQSNGK